MKRTLRLAAFTLLVLVSGCFTAQCASMGLTAPEPVPLPAAPIAFHVIGRAGPTLELLYDTFSAARKEFGFVAYGFARGDSVFMDDLCLPPQQPDSINVRGALWDACPSKRRIAWGHSHIAYWCHLSTIDLQILLARPEPYTILVCRVNNLKDRKIVPDGVLIPSLYAKAGTRAAWESGR